MKYGYDLANQRVRAESYSHMRREPVKKARSANRRSHPLFTVAVLVMTAALCVALLLARARIMAVSGECEALSSRIAELSDEHAHLVIDYESMYSLDEIESYARNVLGMVPGTGG